MKRWLAPVCVVLAVGVFSGCSHANGTKAVPTPSALKEEPHIDAHDIDSLVVGIDEMKSLGFDAASVTHTDYEPVGLPVDPAHPCQVMQLGAISTPDAFGGHWLAFRRVVTLNSSGHAGPEVDQTLALYPDPAGAQAAFRHLTDTAHACKSQPDGTFVMVDMDNSIRLAWTVAARPLGAVDVHVTGNVLYAVSSAQVGGDTEVAAQVADQLKTNIVDPA